MQLLAGIKLCTGRVLTNHPHYEDKDLRERTQQVEFIWNLSAPQHTPDLLPDNSSAIDMSQLLMQVRLWYSD